MANATETHAYRICEITLPANTSKMSLAFTHQETANSQINPDDLKITLTKVTGPHKLTCSLSSGSVTDHIFFFL